MKWFTEVRFGRTSTSDAEHSDRPKEVVTPEIVDKINGLILHYREVAEAVGISIERVHHILHQYLDMEKLSADTRPESQSCVITSKDDVQIQSERLLAPFRYRGRKMAPSLHIRDQGTIKAMGFSGERAPKKARVSLSANKVMATVFRDKLSYEVLPHPTDLAKPEEMAGRYEIKELKRTPILRASRNLIFGGNKQIGKTLN